MIGIVTSCTRFKDNSVDKIQVAVGIYQYITIYCIEDVMLAIGVISTIIFWTKAKTKELVTYFLLRSKTSFGNKWLHQDCTDISVSVFSEANHAIRTIWEKIVVSFDALKER